MKKNFSYYVRNATKQKPKKTTQKGKMKLLLLDVELAPNLATVWGIWNQNIGINQLLETSRVLCFAAKWYGESEEFFFSEKKHKRKRMLKALHKFMDEADAIIHYNGQRFDIPVINREFLLENILPPTPYKQIDLLRVVKKQFRFVSNKLDHVCDELGLGTKVKHQGHELWLACMDGDAEAWRVMEEYNKQDVTLLEKLYDKLLPWITNHPNHAIYKQTKDTDLLLDKICPNCGSVALVKRGTQATSTRRYQRFRCTDCGTWSRSVQCTRIPTESRDNMLTQIK